MFDKLKDLNNLRKMQSEVKKELDGMRITFDDGEYKIVLKGDKKIESIEYDEEKMDDLKDALNKAFKQVDKKVEKQMRGRMGELGLGGM